MSMSLPTPPIEFWWPNFIKAFFVISNTFRPGIDFSIEQSSNSMQCFVVSVTNLLPDPKFRQLFTNFILMDPDVVTDLKQALPKFFIIYPDFLKNMQQMPSSFLVECSKSNDSMFIWVYLLQAYVIQQYKNAGHKIEQPTLNQMKELYNVERMSKYDWGNPIWFVIHMCALYAPEPIAQSFLVYRDLLTCLQYLLPCPKCREHLADNLKHINLETCAKTRDNLFRCSWELHNIVNASVSPPKPQLSFNEAISIYIPK